MGSADIGPYYSRYWLLSIARYPWLTRMAGKPGYNFLDMARGG